MLNLYSSEETRKDKMDINAKELAELLTLAGVPAREDVILPPEQNPELDPMAEPVELEPEMEVEPEAMVEPQCGIDDEEATVVLSMEDVDGDEYQGDDMELNSGYSAIKVATTKTNDNPSGDDKPEFTMDEPEGYQAVKEGEERTGQAKTAYEAGKKHAQEGRDQVNASDIYGPYNGDYYAGYSDGKKVQETKEIHENLVAKYAKFLKESEEVEEAGGAMARAGQKMKMKKDKGRHIDPNSPEANLDFARKKSQEKKGFNPNYKTSGPRAAIGEEEDLEKGMMDDFETSAAFDPDTITAIRQHLQMSGLDMRFPNATDHDREALAQILKMELGVDSEDEFHALLDSEGPYVQAKINNMFDSAEMGTL